MAIDTPDLRHFTAAQIQQRVSGGTYTQIVPNDSYFVQVCNYLWLILFGVVGGIMGRWMYSRRESERED